MERAQFEGLSGDGTGLDAACEKNRAQTRRKAAFHAEFSGLMRDGEISTEALRKFAFEDHSLKDFQSGELMEIYTAFREQKSFEDMIRMVHESTDTEFREAQLVQEFYLVACNQTGRFNETIQSGQACVAKGCANGEVYGSLGKSWLLKHDIAEACMKALQAPNMPAEKLEAARAEYIKYFPDDAELKKTAENGHECLLRAKESYEAGFLISFEYYPGINAAYCMMKLGEINHAGDVARIVNLACLRDGGRETKDFWCATTMLEAACITGADKNEIEAVSRLFLNLEAKKPYLESTIRMLERIKDMRSAYKSDTESVVYALNYMKNLLKSHGRVEFNRVTGPQEDKTPAGAFLRSSFNYRGLATHFAGANFIVGNLKLGGQLPDHCLSRSDWEQFDKLLGTHLDVLIGKKEARHYPPTLREIVKPEDFLAATDLIIRKSFGTDARMLEDMHSAGHAEYDQMVWGLLKLSGVDAQEAVDSRTNISVVMGVGLGDCRHHAQVKQMLFDAWQKRHLNDALRTVYNALKEGDLHGYLEGIDEFKRMEAVELRTMDAVVRAPVQTNEDGKAQLVATENGTMNDIEEHTLTFLVRYGGHLRRIQRIAFADSFYQNRYQWGSGDVSLADMGLDANGQLVIPAKYIKTVMAATNEVVSLPVQLTPTPYTGKRDLVSSDEHGKLLLLGLPVGKDFDLVDMLTQTPRRRMAPLKAIRDWYVKGDKKLSSRKRPRRQPFDKGP